MDRLVFQRLLKDIQKGEIGGDLTYKLDRLTRSLNDFAGMIDARFKQFDVKFISVTEQFDTSTPQGVLFLNLMLMFAQFERQQTSARVKDKVRTSKEKGLWMGGNIPFGYKSVDRKLVVNPETAPMVRQIFELYNETGSIRTILRQWQEQDPEMADHFSHERLRHMITNPIYKGYVPYKGQSFKGRHEAIISEDVWEEAQKRLQNRSKRYVLQGSEFLLMGKCFCRECQVAMSPTHTTKKNGVKYYYLNCHTRAQKLRCQGLNKPVSAAVVERKTFEVLRSLLKNPHQIPGFTDYLQQAAESPQEVLRVLKSLDTLSGKLASGDLRQLIEIFVERVEISKDGICPTLSCARLPEAMPGLLKFADPTLKKEFFIKGDWWVPGDRRQSFMEQGQESKTDAALRQAYKKALE